MTSVTNNLTKSKGMKHQTLCMYTCKTSSFVENHEH